MRSETQPCPSLPPPPLVHQLVKDHFRPGGGVVSGQAKKKIACGAPKTQHHLPKDRFRPGGWSVYKPGRWTRGGVPFPEGFAYRICYVLMQKKERIKTQSLGVVDSGQR
jgi:hypothetical protein